MAGSPQVLLPDRREASPAEDQPREGALCGGGAGQRTQPGAALVGVEMTVSGALSAGDAGIHSPEGTEWGCRGLAGGTVLPQ